MTYFLAQIDSPARFEDKAQVKAAGLDTIPEDEAEEEDMQTDRAGLVGCVLLLLLGLEALPTSDTQPLKFADTLPVGGYTIPCFALPFVAYLPLPWLLQRPSLTLKGRQSLPFNDRHSPCCVT